MPRRRGDGPGHARARRRAGDVAVRGRVANAVTEAHEAHAAAQQDLAGSARAFLSEAALPAVCALNRAGAAALLPAMHRIVNAIQPGLISPEATLYGHWMEWRESNRSGRPLSMGDTLRLTGAGSAMSLRSSARALLHALRTRCSGTRPRTLTRRGPHTLGEYPSWTRRSTFYTNRTRTWRWAKSQYSWKARTRRPPAPDRPTRCTTAPGRPPGMPSCARRSPESPPGAPPSRRRRTHPAAGPTRTYPPPLSRTRGAHHRGQVLWQERPGTPLLLLVVTTRGNPERVFRITPTHLYGARPYPAPPSRRPRRGTGYTPSCKHRRSPPLRGSTSCGSPRHHPSTPGGPGP